MNAVSGNRPFVSVEKLDKMIDRLQRIVHHMNRSLDIDLHRRINQSYFMQKVEELKLLKAQLQEAGAILERVQNRVNEHYPPIYDAWRRDVRNLATPRPSPEGGT